MVNKKDFELLKKEYGFYGSWAIWCFPDKSPKSNTGNMDWASDPKLNEKVGTGFVFVGLNFSEGDKTNHKLEVWKNFHSDYKYQNDYKLRYALTKTPFWGSYITDIIKNYSKTDSSIVMSEINRNKSIIKKNIDTFKKEIALLGNPNPIIIALGKNSFEILNKYLKDYSIIEIKHYACHYGKEAYKKDVLDKLMPLVKRSTV